MLKVSTWNLQVKHKKWQNAKKVFKKIVFVVERNYYSTSLWTFLVIHALIVGANGKFSNV
jgi:hypothetical protein